MNSPEGLIWADSEDVLMNAAHESVSRSLTSVPSWILAAGQCRKCAGVAVADCTHFVGIACRQFGPNARSEKKERQKDSYHHSSGTRTNIA
jgi:hypothetical protein